MVRGCLTEGVVPEQGGEGAGEEGSPVGIWGKVPWQREWLLQRL